MAKRKEVEKSMLTEVSKKIENNNKTVDELIDKIMKEVEVWVKDHKKDWEELSDEERSTLTEPTYLVRKVAEIKYARKSLRSSVYNNLKRSPGNLNEEQRLLGVYETLSKFGYKCPYSDSLLIGGEQQIHIDHIIPVTLGGPTDDWNCIPVCGPCNVSKGNKHLLDWWQDNLTKQEEYKLVKIFEHMTSKLLDETNEIKYLQTEDKTKHLDVITFLNQLYDHIEENKEYIFDCGLKNEKEKTKAIEKKLKELKSTLEKVVKKNNKNLKTDKQYFAEMKEMVKFVQSLSIKNYHKIAYIYFNEIQEMHKLGNTDEEIRQFCFDLDDWFTSFYEKLVEYKNHNGSFLGITMDKEIRFTVSNVRKAYKGVGTTRLTPIMAAKLDAIGFPWEVSIEDRYKDWFTPFYEKLLKYKFQNGSFDEVIQDKEIGNTVGSIRYAKKGKGNLKLTQQMIEKLDAIGFPWEVSIEDRYKDWFTPFYEKLIEYKNKEIVDEDGTIIKNKGSFFRVSKDKELGNTVGRIRQAYKGKRQARLTQEIIDKLNDIGFPWEVEKVDWFTPFYEKLIKYKDQNGSFAGVIMDNEIGMTVNSVRQAYKGKRKTNITQDMIEKLNAIGFPWEASKEDGYRDWFAPFYKNLIQYKEDKGNFIGVTRDQVIGKIVSRVREAYKYKDCSEEEKKTKGLYKLTQEMIDKLNEIGFPWEARPKKVQEDVISV